jgi:hypothetical protein
MPWYASVRRNRGDSTSLARGLWRWRFPEVPPTAWGVAVAMLGVPAVSETCGCAWPSSRERMLGGFGGLFFECVHVACFARVACD